MNTLADRIIERAVASEQRLRKDAFWGRLYTGNLEQAEYAGWLTQMHKYARHIVRGEVALAESLDRRAESWPAARQIAVMSRVAADDEIGHDDLILADLSKIWGCTRDEALARVERTETAPSVVIWADVVTTMCQKSPVSIIGVALALETLAGLSTDDNRNGLLAAKQIDGIEQVVGFLAAHSAEVEDGHANAGKVRANALETPFDRSAAFFGANAALALFEGTAHYLSEAFPARKRELIGASS